MCFFFFLCVVYFTQHSDLQVHSSCCKEQSFFLWSWMIFHCVFVCTHTQYYFFIYSFINESILGCYHVLSIMGELGKTDISLRYGFHFLLDIHPKKGLPNQIVVFLRKLHFVLHSGCTISIHTNSVQGFSFLHILANTYFLFVFDNSHLNRCEMMAHCGFDFYFPVISDVEHVFMCLLAICISSLGKMLVRPFAHFLLGYFFCYLIVEVPYIFWILIPYQMYGLEIFSPVHRLPFHFVWGWGIFLLLFMSFFSLMY